MLTSIVGLLAGSLAVLYACLSYAGSPLLQTSPSFLRHKGDLLWLVGWAMIGLALMTGMAGFLLKANLGLERILLGGGGLALLFTLRWWGRKGGKRRKAEESAVLFLVLLALFYGSPVRTSGDSRWAVHTAMSFARGHWGDLSEYAPILEHEGLYAIEYYKDQPRTLFPIGVSVLSIPAVAIVTLVRPAFNGALRYALPVELEGLLAASYGALIGVLFFWVIYVRFRSHYLALGSMFILCFCTSIWSTATRALWQHTPVVVMFVVALALLLAARARPPLIQYLGLPLMMSVISRPTAGVAAIVFSLYVLLFYRRWFVRYVSWSLLLAAPWVAYNFGVYDLPLPPYYLPASHDSRALGEALLGNLFSPARGLFIYSPVLLLALPGFVLSLRERGERSLHVAFAAMIVLHWWAVSRFGQPWWGGHSYGPRFMTDVLPFLVYFVAVACRPLAGLGRVAITGGVFLLAGVSLLVHAQGALNLASFEWNAGPVEINRAPTRLWSWRDPQFARGLWRWGRPQFWRSVVRPERRPLLNLTGGGVPADVRLYETGMVVRFSADSRLDPSVLQSGWWMREKWGVWSDGYEARLVLDPRPSDRWRGSGDLLLIVRAQGFVVPQHPRQMVDVVVNDTLVALWTFEVGDGVIERRARVGAASAKLPLVVTFRLHNPVTPAELGISGDRRRLGIGLTSLRLAPTGDDR